MCEISPVVLIIFISTVQLNQCFEKNTELIFFDTRMSIIYTGISKATVIIILFLLNASNPSSDNAW